MYGDRCHPEFITGMHYFLNVAEANRRSNGFMYCPCSSCKNMKDYPTSKTLHIHLLENGFMPSYNCWTKHGERGVILEDNEEEEDSDNYPLFTEDGGSRMGEDEAEEEPIFDEPIFDDPDDDLGRAILDAKMNCGNEKERLKLEKMLEDHNKLLYPNCENGQKKLGTTLELLQWKAENGTSDKGFEKLLKIIKKMLPGENVLPSSTSKRGPTRVLKGEGRLALTAFKDSGEPVEPKEFCRKFTSQSGVIVRDHVPISIQEWHKPKNPESGASYVNDAMKNLLWDTLMTKFSLPEDMTEGQKNKVKEWTLKKMAIQFQTFKKNLWDKYKNEDPVFDDTLVKIKDHWAAFKDYKKSSTFVSRSKKNTENAAKKKLPHHLGSGGYKSAIPKWTAFENKLMDHGIVPQTWDWPERSKFWLFAHGAGLDPKTGLIVAKGKWKEKIEESYRSL
ncbi:hypothetical protein QYE76_016008 [Lolium multiflorum]|uniref:Transposase-associated domain-containing protein n=1 Tax=Lolium multiflorum TaxID=4521 RepID=A0AAD8U5H3_LOLMU|nr:hypothetical protein QYE76_016008 [Lolium multiflorum]